MDWIKIQAVGVLGLGIQGLGCRCFRLSCAGSAFTGLSSFRS